jgi:hypothetical protein
MTGKASKRARTAGQARDTRSVRLIRPSENPNSRRAAVALAMTALVVLAALITASRSEASEVPRWAIVSTTNPTNLVPGSPQNEIQDLTVAATGGTFKLSSSKTGITQCGKSETTPIAYNAPASEVQSALVAACAFLEGGVTVTGGPGGSPPYTITFTGSQLGNKPIGLLSADSSSLTGGPATATVRQAARGQYGPQLVVSVTNVGGGATDEAIPITIEDTLLAGSELTATALTGYDAYHSGFAQNGEGGAAMSCSTAPTLVCSYSGKLDPGDALIVTIHLSVMASLAPGTYANKVAVKGGGLAEALLTEPMTVSNSPGKFGAARGSVIAATSTSQAGAHADVTTGFTFNTTETDEAAAYPKDIHFDLPPGEVGSTVGMPRCPIARIVEQNIHPNACPPDAAVGAAIFTISEGAAAAKTVTAVAPIYNIAPASGEPAAFAFDTLFFPVRLDTGLLPNGDYRVRVTAAGLPQAAETLSSWVTIWGVPADHDGPGEDKSVYNLFGGGSFGGPNPSQTRVPLLTSPQQCSAALLAEMSTDSWVSPNTVVTSGPVSMGSLTGCESLSFHPSFSMLPDTLEAGAPAGYSFNLTVPQNNEPDALATPTVKSVKLTLPAGTVINPAVAGGLAACSDAQFAAQSGLPASCASHAQIGTAEVKTPPLALPLQGQLYLAEPRCNPCSPADAQGGRMIRLFLQVIGEGDSPIVVKLEGVGTVDQQTGQITTSFERNPQLPFSELKVKLNGGSSAPLANPRRCGSISSGLDVAPWSAPFSADSLSTSSFEVNEGCFGSQFGPTFSAGVTGVQAGGYSPLTVSFGRSDRDQFLSGLELHMPPGLLGKLSTVNLCREPQASEGTCGQESLIGHVQTLVGAGPSPYPVAGGQVFLTAGYKGAPFGLSIVVPAVAGPYTLAGTTGRGTVALRASISVDRHSSALTIKSDPLPTALDGIPLQIKLVNVTIDRKEFMFNPTDCSKLAIGGTLTSNEGSSAAVSSPFQVANCATLPFTPKFTVLTHARTSKLNGAYLHVKVTSGPGQANIGKVKVDLPKQLPSRLTTLQQACPDATFNANPASCPAGSLVGTATAVTPVLKNPLTGPAYLVSHAGAAFPDLVIVLQGEGITLDLVGNTDIKKGVTISTFNSVPDAPISTFDLVLSQGPHSALAATANLCRTALKMPTAITGQNGALIRQTTRIAVSGCPPHKSRKARSTTRRGNAKPKAHSKRK